MARAGTDAEKAEREKGSFLAYRDDAGRVSDFHSLRHTFISNLANAGVHPKLAQALARHSDINLTMSRYTHTIRGQESETLAALPDLSPLDHSQARATGTDGHAGLPVCHKGVNAPAVLADCLAEKVSEECNPVQSQTTTVDGGRRAQVAKKVRETPTNTDDRRADKAVRLAGFEPATYGLGNRCSIP